MIDDEAMEVLNEIKTQIISHAKNAARSKQKAIGVSEISQQCERRIGYRLLGQERSNDPDPWFTILGTAMHAWLEDCYKTINKSLPEPRYLIEKRVTVPGKVPGKLDIYDLKTKAVRDWKFVGETTLRKVRATPDESYLQQAHTYALALSEKGFEVEWIEIVFLPRAGFLRTAHIHRERFDRARAEKVVARHASIKELVKTHGFDALPMLPATGSACEWCSFFLAASPDLRAGCPGSTSTR